MEKILGIYDWECEDEKCGWKGDYPTILDSFEFLGIDEDEVDENYEIEFVEVCPRCGKPVIMTHKNSFKR